MPNSGSAVELESPGIPPEAPADSVPGSADRRVKAGESRWFWVTLVLSSTTIVAFVFAVWELVEKRLFRDVDYLTLHRLYITRGVASSLLLASWAAWYVYRQRRRSEEELRRSREHYRRLLEASPGAVALYDSSLRVAEWNATAERLYGYSKEEVLERALPTVPAEGREELARWIAQAEEGRPTLDVETERRGKDGTSLEVEVSLLPFPDPERRLFLEVSSDIRERVRLRRTMLDIEKLASMGKMAAGTAHHLNTPLASMLLRIQMMRDQAEAGDSDLEQLESGIRFCQQFVRRLLEFSRRPASERRPEELTQIVRSVVGFLAPTLEARPARVTLDLEAAEGVETLADRNLIEALFSILLANSLDAIGPGGTIRIGAALAGGDSVEFQVSDDGSGIAAENLSRVFEPFFTTKGSAKGTGLGLAIARNILIEHGGTLRLESAPGRGTTVFLRFPLWRAEEREAGSR